jgi:RNA recognition motif-containing protein
LFVGGLPLQVTESQLYNYFRKFGKLSKCEIPIATQAKKKKFAFVEIVNLDYALTILEVQQHVILGTTVKVERALSTLEIFHKQLEASKCKLFVSGDMIARTNSLVISKELSDLGQVERVKKLKCASKTFNSCFVTMKSIADAEYLLEQKSLVLPTLKKVTFKRFVPRVRKNLDDSITEDMQKPIPNMTLPKSSPQLTNESFKETQNNAQERFHGIKRTIVIRPGLCIVSNIRQNWLDIQEAKRLTLLGHKSHTGSSSQQSEFNYIRNLDRNLRFNISGLPSFLRTKTFKANPSGCPVSLARHF